jgi:NTE family protein
MTMTSGKREKQREKIESRGGSSSSAVNKRNKDGLQNALVFQGGGALAAYEVGAYAALYFWIKKDRLIQNGSGEKNHEKNIFDIIAGTSGGAINASIIVSHVLEKRKQGFNVEDSWRGTLKKLLDFWNYISSNPDYSKWGPYSIFGEIVEEPFLPVSGSSSLPLNFYRWKWPPDESTWKSRWDQANSINKSVATGEAARRYYSAKEYLYSGAPNIFSSSTREYDNRFYDDFVMPTNVWYHYNNTPLKESINQYAIFPIATSFFPQLEDSAGNNETSKEQEQKPHPRLLMVSVDVETGAVVTFDSYKKYEKYEKDNRILVNIVRKSKSGDYTKTKQVDAEGKGNEIEIKYNCGIMVEHVIASSSVPINYDYAEVPLHYDDDLKPSKDTRKFWDGGVQSNTPLRELIQAHEDYWKIAYEDFWEKVSEIKVDGRMKVEKEQILKSISDIKDIPSLRVYIANIWPLQSKNSSDIANDGIDNIVPLDHDGIKNRLYDLRLQDKTLHEEKVAYLIYDYIELAQRLKEKAEKSGINISDILREKGQSRHRDGKRREYGQLLEKKVKITEVIRFQREPDSDDISSKLHDYSSHTISQLIIDGVKETLGRLVEQEFIRVKGKREEELRDQGKLNERDKIQEEEIQKYAIKKGHEELDKFIKLLDQAKEEEQLTETRDTTSNKQNYILLSGTTIYNILRESANVAKIIAGTDFPKNKQDIVKYAEQNRGKTAGDPNVIIKMLNQIPNKEYNSIADLEHEVGRIDWGNYSTLSTSIRL